MYVSLKKAKKEYNQNLNKEMLWIIRNFAKKENLSFLSDKPILKEKPNLTENEKTLRLESETAGTLNNFFSNIVKKPQLPKFSVKIQLPKTLRIQFSKPF